MTAIRTEREYVSSGRFKVGDRLLLVIDNLTYQESAVAVAMKQDEENMIFCLQDCLKKERAMNYIKTNIGGYEASRLRRDLRGTILRSFPGWLSERMVPFDNGDLLRIPTEQEIFGRNYCGVRESSLIEQWEPMKDRRNRIALLGQDGVPIRYWLQNPFVSGLDSKSAFAAVDLDGTSGTDGADFCCGVRPVFQLQNEISAGERENT